jgi:hypothetical protein
LAPSTGALIGLLDQDGHALVGLEALGRHRPQLLCCRPTATTSKWRTTLKFSSRRPLFSPRSIGVVCGGRRRTA